MFLGEVLERSRVHARGHDLQRLDDPRARPVEVGVPVGDVHTRPPASRQRIAQDGELSERAVEPESARLHDHDVRLERDEAVALKRWRVLTGTRHQRLSSGEGHQLRHPHAADHHRVDPFDGQDMRPLPDARGATGDVGDSRAEGSDHSAAGVRASDCPGHTNQVVPDLVELRRVEADDVDVLLRQSGDRGLDVVEGNRADVAEVLGDDHVGPDLPQPVDVDLVDRQCIPENVADSPVDGLARR